MGKKVNLNSVTELKTETDEFLPQALLQLGYEQSFALIDLKLALGLVTVAISAFLYYLEKKVSFKDSYYVIAALISVYFIVSAVLYYLSKGPQYKDNTYIGYRKGHKISVYTWTKPFEPVYRVKIVFGDGVVFEEKIAFMKMFDEFGFLNEPEASAIFKSLLEKKAQ